MSIRLAWPWFRARHACKPGRRATRLASRAATMRHPMHTTFDLASLGDDFWTWRARTQPMAGDDIPRIDRPTDWAPDWSPTSVAAQRSQLAAFRERHATLGAPAQAWPINQQVDYRLIGSTMARVEYELEVTRGWQRNPYF